MARIKTYPIDNVVTDNDIVIGSDFNDLEKTKNYSVGALREYINSGLDPETGGQLKITTLTVENNSFSTPDLYVNQLNPALVVLQYEIVFIILNGKTWVFRRNDNTFGLGQTQTVLSDFTFFDVSQAVPTPNLEEVLIAGNVADNLAFLNSLGLYDEPAELYSNISSVNSEFIYKDTKNQGVRASYQSFTYDNNINKFNVKSPNNGEFNNATATFQNASGTIAYLSDIPIPNVQNIVGTSTINVETLSGGTFRLSTIPQDIVPLYVVETQVYTTTTNESLVTNGGGVNIPDVFTAEDLQFRIVFNDSITRNEDFSLVNVAFVNLWKRNSLGVLRCDRVGFAYTGTSIVGGETLVVSIPRGTFVTSDEILKITLSIQPNFINGYYYDIPEYMKTWFSITA
jgi:hypothetical protein